MQRRDLRLLVQGLYTQLEYVVLQRDLQRLHFALGEDAP